MLRSGLDPVIEKGRNRISTNRIGIGCGLIQNLSNQTFLSMFIDQSYNEGLMYSLLTFLKDKGKFYFFGMKSNPYPTH